MTCESIEQIHLAIEDSVATLVIDNPAANTWTLDLLLELQRTIDCLADNPNIYAIVLTGKGERFFSAGADLNVFASGDKSQAFDMAQAFSAAFETLANFGGVTIAAINGYAMGGGLEAALACDLRIAEQHAKLALPEAKVGLLPCAGGTQNLTNLVGEGWAKRMILCGEQVDARKALEIGLVEEVVATGEALAHAQALAKQVAHQSPVSVRACKTLINGQRSTSHQQGLVNEREKFMQLFDSDDQKEGVQAFLQKRKPQWMNR